MKQRCVRACRAFFDFVFIKKFLPGAFLGCRLFGVILIDCMPSLGVMTVNALVAADRVVIPVQAAYLPVKGLQQLLKTVLVVKKRLNKDLEIEGILIRKSLDRLREYFDVSDRNFGTNHFYRPEE